MDLSPAQRDALILAEQQVRLQVRTRLVHYATTMWNGLGSWRDSDIERFVATLVPRVMAGKQTIAGLTDRYLATMTGAAAAGTIDVANLRGVPDAEVYQRPATEMRTALAQGKSMSDALALGSGRLVSLVMTDLQMANVRQAGATLSRSSVQEFGRTLTGRENCALCVIASTQRYHRGNLLPIHPGCVPAGTAVAARNVLAVSRRWYSGELVILTTAAGDDVTVTANHPVLTDQGWVPAHAVRVGDDLFRSSARHGVVDRVPDEAQRPAMIEDVWRAAGVAGLVRMPLAPEDFHADGAKGEVEVVPTDGNLSPIGDVTFGEPGGESSLGIAHGGRVLLAEQRVLVPLGVGLDVPTDGLMGGGGLGPALRRAHLGSSVQPGSGAITRFDAPAQEFGPQSAPVYVDRGMDLVRRLAGHIERDRIVKLHRIGWSGHVYNLHTAEGWYASNSHIVSNCDCGVRPLAPGTHAQVINPTLLESTQAQIDAHLGGYDRGARDLGHGKTVAYQQGGERQADYTDLIMTSEHGEYGPTLHWRNDTFTGPGSLAI